MERVKITNTTKISKLGTVIFQVELLVDIDDDHLAGSLGGWIETIDNITNPNTGEIEGAVLDEAQIVGSARIYDNAIVKNDTRVSDNAVVCGNAVVGATSRIMDNTVIDDNAIVENNCLATGNTHITNDVKIISRCVLHDKILDINPFQINGSNDNVILLDDRLSIGCVTYPLSVWENNNINIGKSNSYSDELIAEYTGYVELARAEYNRTH